MKRHYLIMVLWWGTIFTADQTPQEEVVPTPALKVDYAEKADYALQADHALSADKATQAEYALRCSQADYATCAIHADMVGGQSADQIVRVVQKVETAAAANVPNTFIMRDEQGNCAATIITADLQGNAATATYALKAQQADYAANALQADKAVVADQALQSKKASQAEQAACAECASIFTEPLSGDVVGNQSSTVVNSVGGQSAAIIATATQTIQAATAHTTPATVVMRDEQGDFSAHIITADVQGNAATATYALKAQQADYAASTLQADKAAVAEQATCAACASIFTEPLAGDVTGNQTTTVVSTVGGQSASTIAAVVHTIQQATSECANNTLIVRDAKGDFSARNIRANLLGNATTATHANTFNKALDGDVVGKQFATVVKTVGGQSAPDIASTVQSVQAATARATPTTLVMRDAQGDFVARVITADLQGNATTATHAVTADSAVEAQRARYADKAECAPCAQQATYALQADDAKHAMQADKATVADQAHQSEHATYAQKADYALQADSAKHALRADHALSADKVLQAEYAVRSSHADYAACAAHADKTVQADQATCAACASIFTEPLSGDVTGNQTSTVVSSVGGQSASTIATAVQTVQAATARAIPTTLVMRDEQGDFSAHIITADLQGNAATATQAMRTEHADHAINADKATVADQALQSYKSAQAEQATSAACASIFTEPLVGDVTGNQNSTVVATVGGYTAAEIAAAVQKIQTTPSDDAKTITITTDAGVAIPKGAKLFIRGSQNIKVRASDASIVISLNPSPSVNGSLTVGTTITAGTGLQVVSGGAAITGDTHINSAGHATTTLGNASSSTICNGPLCLKQVSSGQGMPLGIDADGNVVVLGSESRAYSDKKMHALLRALVTVVAEQQKKIEHIESLVYKQ